MKTIKFDENEIENAAEIVRNGEILAFPTETVYGLGCIFDNESAFKRMVEIKRRPPNKPFSLMCSSLSEAFSYCSADDKAKKVMERFLPGELTVLVRAREGLPNWVTLGTEVIGIRVPDDEYIRSLFKTIGKPCLVTSANRSGEATSRYYEEVVSSFDGECAGIVKGECVSLTPSTIIDLSKDDSLTLIRKGPIPFEKIDEYWRNLK